MFINVRLLMVLIFSLAISALLSTWVVPYLERFRRHVLFVKGKYFVILRIQYGSETDTISCDPRSSHQPDIVVDYGALR